MSMVSFFMQIMTTVHTDHLKPFSKEVDVWIFIVSVSAGLLLLLLLILLLWFVSIICYHLSMYVVCLEHLLSVMF